MTVVSADAHAGADVEMYREYLDPAYHDDLDRLAREHTTQARLIPGANAMGSRAALSMLDDDGAIASGAGVVGAWDMTRRLAEMDREGVAAELVLPGVTTSMLPFFGAGNRPYPVDLRVAGGRAYHRWLYDAIEPARHRLFPVAEPTPCLDIDAALDELRWVADHGFVAVHVPGSTADPALPPLWDAHYEPFWAACEDLGLVLVMHAGFGLEQGSFQELLEKQQELLRRPDLTDEEKRAHMQQDPLFNTRATRYRRALWHMLLGGVFDRHPSLKLAFTELGADWIGPVLAVMDERFAADDTPLRRPPSSYWATNCGVVASAMRRVEVELRHEIGIDRLMFGTDFPHPESTWPNTRDWMRAAFAGVPEHEVRALVGGNAIRFFGLDAAPLAEVAARIGPTVADLTAGGDVAPEKIEAFDARGSFSKPARPVDRRGLADAFDEDVRLLRSA